MPRASQRHVREIGIHRWTGFDDMTGKIILLGEDTAAGDAVLSRLEVEQRRGRDLRVVTYSLQNLRKAGQAPLRSLLDREQPDTVICLDDSFNLISAGQGHGETLSTETAMRTLIAAGVSQIVWICRRTESPTLIPLRASPRQADTSEITYPNVAEISGLHHGVDIRTLLSVDPFVKKHPGHIATAMTEIHRAHLQDSQSVAFSTSTAGPIDLLTGQDLASAALFLLDMDRGAFDAQFGPDGQVQARGIPIAPKALLEEIAEIVGYTGRIILQDANPLQQRGTPQGIGQLADAGWVPTDNFRAGLSMLYHRIRARVDPDQSAKTT